MARRLRILTWHVHGNYLYYLTRVPHDWYLVTDDARTQGHSGRSGTLPWGENVHEAHVGAIARMQFDAVLFQSKAAYLEEQFNLLTAAQQRLPRVYLEHDPPQEHPTNTRHWVNDRDVLLVHVTPFNALMWDCGDTPTQVIEHGVRLLRPARYSGELESGIVVVNNIAARGADVHAQVAAAVPLVLVGMGAELAGGLGEVPNHELPGFMARHRYFFNPIRYTSLGLALVEAMMVGLPVVGLATTELATVIRNGDNGFVDTRIDRLVDAMQVLRRDRAYAQRLGEAARRTAEERFSIDRFIGDWMGALQRVTG
jgi:glycosyltransferase involved in cell wall biosynthesis